MVQPKAEALTPICHSSSASDSGSVSLPFLFSHMSSKPDYWQHIYSSKAAYYGGNLHNQPTNGFLPLRLCASSVWARQSKEIEYQKGTPPGVCDGSKLLKLFTFFHSNTVWQAVAAAKQQANKKGNTVRSQAGFSPESTHRVWLLLRAGLPAPHRDSLNSPFTERYFAKPSYWRTGPRLVSVCSQTHSDTNRLTKCLWAQADRTECEGR